MIEETWSGVNSRDPRSRSGREVNTQIRSFRSKSYGLFPAPGGEDHRGYTLKHNAPPQSFAEGESCLRRLWKTPVASAWGCPEQAVGSVVSTPRGHLGPKSRHSQRKPTPPRSSPSDSVPGQAPFFPLLLFIPLKPSPEGTFLQEPLCSLTMAAWPPANTRTTCTAPPSALCLSMLMLRRVSSDLPVPHSALHPEAKGNGSSIYLSLARGERAVNRVDTRYLLTDGPLHQLTHCLSEQTDVLCKQ